MYVKCTSSNHKNFTNYFFVKLLSIWEKYYLVLLKYNICKFASKNVTWDIYWFDFYPNCKHPWWGIIFWNGRRMHRFILYLIWCSFWFCTPPPLLISDSQLLYLQSPKMVVARYRMICLLSNYHNLDHKIAIKCAKANTFYNKKNRSF